MEKNNFKRIFGKDSRTKVVLARKLEKQGLGSTPALSLAKIWCQKKVSEPVSEKIGTGKSLGTRVEKNWHQKSLQTSTGNISHPNLRP